MPFYIILALSAFLFSLLGTRIAIIALRKRTQPADIKVLKEKKAAPLHSGGIVVVFSLIICLVATDISYGLILAMLLLTAISMLNELIDIPRFIRIAVQFMAIAIPLSVMKAGLFANFLPPEADKIITAILWVYFMNIFSSIENARGPSSIEIISAAVGLCLIAVFAGSFPSVLSIYSLILAASTTGFLWWNWPPAKIRLGDVGIIPIVFLLGYLLLIASNAGYHYTALIVPAYLIADGIITGLKRLLGPDKKAPYYFEKARMNGFSEWSIARYIIGINIFLVFLATRCVIDPDIAVFYLATAYLCVFMLLGFFAHNSSGERSEK